MVHASMCHPVPFSALTLKNDILFDIGINNDCSRKEQIKMWFSLVCTLIDDLCDYSGDIKMLWTRSATSCKSTKF